jgi:hypothetical protein
MKAECSASSPPLGTIFFDPNPNGVGPNLVNLSPFQSD